MDKLVGKRTPVRKRRRETASVEKRQQTEPEKSRDQGSRDRSPGKTEPDAVVAIGRGLDVAVGDPQVLSLIAIVAAPNGAVGT